jgi:hypothetical protein
MRDTKVAWLKRSRASSANPALKFASPQISDHYLNRTVKVCSRIRPARVDGAPAAVEEPMLPVPAERFLTEPVHAR